MFTVSKFTACRRTWYYSAIPFAPIIYLASLAIWIAFMQLFLFIMDICSTDNRPFSFSRETWWIPSSPNDISTSISASFFWTNWKDAKGTPNWFLSRTYFLALWKQSSAAPRTPQEIPNLALLRHENGPFSPFTVGKAFYLGILTLSITISPVIEDFNDNFPFILFAWSPFIPFSNIKPLISPF